MEVEVEYISASCNCTYNCIELADGFILFASNKALVIYDLLEEKVTCTEFAHEGRINCVRFLKNRGQRHAFAVSSCAGGKLALWKYDEDAPSNAFLYTLVAQVKGEKDSCLTVCDGVQVGSDPLTFIVGCLTSMSRVQLYSSTSSDSTTEGLRLLQTIEFGKSLANELTFHMFDESTTVLALGMDSGAITLYDYQPKESSFIPGLTLQKHEDWVRCIGFSDLGNGDVLMASGGQDSFIAVWRFTKQDSTEGTSSFEFQVHQFKNYNVVFESMIIGHEGWVNSLHWNPNGSLLSCSSDQSVILWENLGDLWMEKTRLGVMGGMVPGGTCAKGIGDTVITSGFQGAVQIWVQEEEDWRLKPSITGHFRPITDMDYDPDGNFIVTSSEDQTTRAHAPWGKSRHRWHEISRPQIHGHDIFACRMTQDMIVSGAEEKILRAFQPTQVFYNNLEDAGHIHVPHKRVAAVAYLPALGLSNQEDDGQSNSALAAADLPLDTRLDEDFLRAQTLWVEISKLYGHVYEIACIATSPVHPIIASASQATKQQFAGIILWCTRSWKSFGEFPHHKLNVTGMEFSPNGRRLLSVSRDRTWAVWNVVAAENDSFKLELMTTGAEHSRALSVGTWNLGGDYFITGGRDKKLVVWKNKITDTSDIYEPIVTEQFTSSISSAAVNSDNTVAVGLETGEILLLRLSIADCCVKHMLHLSCRMAHHDAVRRLKFNPKDKDELASSGSDHILKVFRLNSSVKT